MRFWTLLLAITCALVLPAVPAQARTQSCGAGYVRLTFDDGPSRRATSEILDTLSAHGVTATFFVVGQMAAASPGIVRRESREGHNVGNHSWDHPDLATLDRTQVESELQRTNDLIEQATGTTPTEWRPPHGATDAARRQVAAGPGPTPGVWTGGPRGRAGPPPPPA